MNATLTPGQQRIVRWRHDPASMVREEFGAEPEPYQVALLDAFADPSKRRIAMKANKGPGKTTGLAWCILNFLACYGEPGEHPKGAATSITQDNIDDNLWPELAKWMARSPFFTRTFEWAKTRIFCKDHPETWFFSKRTYPKSGDSEQQANTLAGLHAKYLLFVIDESGGVPAAVMAAAEGGLASRGWAKLVQAGNPTHLEGPLYDAVVTHRHLWDVIEITGDPDDPNRSQRVPVKWAREQIELYGIDNPWVKVNVFGQFPPSSINALLGPDEVRAAMKRVVKDEDYTWAQKRIGIDVARFGDDRTVLFPRQGLVAFEPVVMRGERTTAIAARAMLAKRNWGSELEIIDDTGHWGHGVIDNLISAGHAPIGVQFHAPALDKRYKNRRVEGWLQMADWIKRGGAVPPVPELVAELTTPTYTFVNGQFALEEKDMVKKRLGRSPDLADALALTFMVPDLPSQDGLPVWMRGRQRSEAAHEYDPFAEARA